MLLREWQGARAHILPGRARFAWPALRHNLPLARSLTAALERLPAVRRAEVNPDTGSLLILYDPSALSVADIATRLGLASPPPCAPDRIKPAAMQTALTGSTLAVVAAKRFLIGPSMLSQSMVTWDLAGLVTVSASYPFLRSGLEQLFRHGRLSGELLLGAAGLGATVLRENLVGLAVIFLASLNQLLFARTLDGCEAWAARLVHPEERLGQKLRPGDTVRIRAGRHLPADGVIISGSGLVDESRLSGQSGLRRTAPGDRVLAGSRLAQGQLTVRTTALGNGTTVGNGTTLGSTLTTHAPRHDLLLADGHSRTAAHWGLVALGASVLTGIITGSGRRTLATLIAAAPAASALAAVLPLNAATAAAARSGILTKGAQAIAAAAKVDTVLFDKTGTLTTGSPSVVAVLLSGRGWSATRVLQLAAAAERGAVHPTALAIRKAAHQHRLQVPQARETRELIGQGAVASVAGHRVAVASVAEHRVAIGSEVFIRSQSTLSDWARQSGRRLHDDGHSVAYVACDGDIIGVIGVADPIRPGAPTALRLLHGSGVRRIGILTGDHEAAARPVASKLGLTGCWASACPEAKAELIARLQAAGRTVALVGDGLNDAPGLAAADLGMLLGRSHASITLGAADAIIVGDDLSKVGELIRLGRRAARATRQNQWLAAGMNAAGLCLAASGMIGPVGASLWHNLTALTVVINAMRLLPR